MSEAAQIASMGITTMIELMQARDEIKRLKEQLAKQEQRSVSEQRGEPVAWHVQEWSGTGKKFLTFDAPPETPSLRDEVVNPVWKPLVFADTTPPQGEARGLSQQPAPQRSEDTTQKKPLTDEAIATVYWGATGQSLRPQDNVLAHKFAKAIEAAHGIKENT